VAAVKAETASIQTDTNDIQTRVPAALVGGRMSSDIGAVSANAITAAGLDPDVGTELADALLNRDMSAGTDTNARSPRNALRFLRNKWSIAAGTLTVTKEDDATSAWTAALTTDAAAVPIITSDPA
jgi:hypothetical protein